jgi:hypothetical protein
VRQLVKDQPVEQVRRFVERHHDPVAHRLGECADPFLRRAGDDVLLLKLAARLEEDERDLEREVVFQLRADLLVRAFGVAGDPLKVLLDLRVVVNLEVVGRVNLPVEVVVADLILAEVGDVGGLRRGEVGCQQECRYERRDRNLAHKFLLTGAS